MRKWYLIHEQHALVLDEWQNKRFSEVLVRKSDNSAQESFRYFVTRLSTLQIQLDEGYQWEKYMVNRLLTAIDFPDIQAAIKEIIARKGQHAKPRIVNRLDNAPVSAGRLAEEVRKDNQNREGHTPEEFYALRKRFEATAMK